MKYICKPQKLFPSRGIPENASFDVQRKTLQVRLMPESAVASNEINRQTELAVEGMTCSNCARHVTEALQDVPGVASAGVSLDQGKATVRWKPGIGLQPDLAIKAVEAAGYHAREIIGNTEHPTNTWSPFSGWKFNVVLGLAAFGALVIAEWVFKLGMNHGYQWFAFILATFVQVFCGARFYRGAWNQFKQGSSNMDTLVALGSTTAYVFSAWGLFSRYYGHLYFMEAVGIITLISVGHWMEARVSAKASSSLQALLQLAPQTARLRDGQGERQVPINELRAADTIILKPGDRVPTDGDVLEGFSAVDESMLTGESLPVDKKLGDKVYTGTINLNGTLIARVTATGEGTALSNIIAAVQRAQTSRAEIQRLGDRVSSIFVPIVIAIAILTALWWGFAYENARAGYESLPLHFLGSHLPETAAAAAFIFAAGVLIVACPCAMGLATPVAIMAGTNAASQRGILIRDGIALEKAGKITAIIFDKTGTLTVGKPSVNATKVLAPTVTDPEFELKLAAALARRSNHPLSQSVATLSTSDFAFTNWREIRGAGVQAQFQPNRNSFKFATARLCSLKWLSETNVATEFATSDAEKWMAEGATVLGLAVDEKLVAIFSLRDTVKSGAGEVIKQLKTRGLNVYLLTGDNRRTARAIAEQLGIPSENTFAEVKPEDKAAHVQRLQREGRKVAFVGDGINDAPALEQSDLGIAVSRASDIAHEASDIILLKSDIHGITETLGLAQATLRTIIQNLFWAFFYNAAGIPLAALGFLSPLLCAAAMGFSDLIVIGNALRLRRWKLKS